MTTGVYIRTEKQLEQIRLMRGSNKGRKFSKEWRDNLSKSHKGFIPWITGRKHTEESKEKMRGARPNIQKEKNPNWKGGNAGYYLRNKERINKYSKKWSQEHREIVSFYAKERHRRNKGAIGLHTLEEWETLKKMYDYMCLCCKRVEPEIKLEEDHIVPITMGGSNFINNIQPLCRSCNARKNIKIINYIERMDN
jgi:5-methylcytosine-specific restriction endonuclease McrA